MIMSRGIFITIIVMLTFPAFSFGQSKVSNLKPSKDYWDHEDKNVRVHISRVSRNRKLASVGDTLYMLDNRNRIVWRWCTGGPPLTDIPIIDSSRIIYAIAFDLIWVALDSSTGKEKWRDDVIGGRATYSQIKLYDKDKYLVVTYMEAYRDNLFDKSIQDKLDLCRGDKCLWETDIPPGAEIKVRGRRVFAVYKYKKRTRRKEILIPPQYQ